MGKATKEHRKRVQARNHRIEQEKKLFKKYLNPHYINSYNSY